MTKKETGRGGRDKAGERGPYLCGACLLFPPWDLCRGREGSPLLKGRRCNYGFGRVRQGREDKGERHLVKKDREEILSRAYSRLGEDRYNLIFNNCEHFASWCATGIPVSFQAALAAAEIIILLKRGGI